MQDAVALYRREFQPSQQLDAPYVLAGVNVIAADDEATARDQHQAALIERAKLFLHRSGGPASPTRRSPRWSHRPDDRFSR